MAQQNRISVNGMEIVIKEVLTPALTAIALWSIQCVGVNETLRRIQMSPEYSYGLKSDLCELVRKAA